MPKRRRLFTPVKKQKLITKAESTPERQISNNSDSEVNVARGRLKGALKEVLEPGPPSEESESSRESSPAKRVRHNSLELRDFTDEDLRKPIKSPPRQSYVLKLFDRSVDLSQFRDDSPLYPICRAWMANQPKANYNHLDSYKDFRDEAPSYGGLELPGPEGDPVPKIPDLLPVQLAANKNNINLNYREAPPPAREQLLRTHMQRWAAVKQAWQDHIQLKEARYDATQQVLNSINLEYPR